MQAEVHAGLSDEVVGHALPAIGIESRGVADGLGVGVGVEIEGAVAAPFVPQFLGGLAVIGGRDDCGPSFCKRSTYSETMPVTVIS